MENFRNVFDFSATNGRQGMNRQFIRASLSMAVVLVLLGIAEANRNRGGNCAACHNQRVDGDLEVDPALLEIEAGSTGTFRFNVLDSPSTSAISLSDLVGAPFDFTVVNNSDWDMFQGNSYYVSDYNQSTISLTLEIAPDSPTGEFPLHAQLAGNRNGRWGLVETYTVRITEVAPELACDFNGDRLCNVSDIDLLTAVGDLTIGVSVPPADPAFDFDANGVIDINDINLWLAAAASENGFSEPFLSGDADLNGMVDAADLNALALHWRQQVPNWSDGDFTGNGAVDAADLNKLALNWRNSVPLAAATQNLPEPSAAVLLLFAAVGIICGRRACC